MARTGHGFSRTRRWPSERACDERIVRASSARSVILQRIRLPAKRSV